MNNPDDAASSMPYALSTESLIDEVHGSFSSAYREKISRELVAEIVNGLDLSRRQATSPAPLLKIARLIFSGEVLRRFDTTSRPFRYDQTFQSGVNVILIPDNDIGKTSIMKTISYVLTGDDGSYDADVKQWIRKVWLQFSVGEDNFSMHIDRTSDPDRGVLSLGTVEHDLSMQSQPQGSLFDVRGGDEIRARLQQFFFDRLNIDPLSWTQVDVSSNSGVSERQTSWRTFFQALKIPESSDEYLLCDTQHNIGNQQGLIFSTFLGLQLVEPLNRLGVETSLLTKQEKASAGEVQAAKAEIDRIASELEDLRNQVKAMRDEQDAKKRAYQVAAPAQHLADLSNQILENASETDVVEGMRQRLTSQIRQANASARSYREAVALKLRFTGLEVTLCPNCDAAVEEAAVIEEREHHTCRLCGRAAHAATASELAELEAAAQRLEDQAKQDTLERAAQVRRLESLTRQREQLDSERTLMQEVTSRGIDAISLTETEETKRDELLQRIGELRARQADAQALSETKQSLTEDTDLRTRVIKKTREILREKAEQLNQTVLERLSEHIQEVSEHIGVESISDINISPLGVVNLKKHGVPVSFTGIQNPGERVRVKLAFFLAMMRLGREQGGGRHPGFLLLDQPAPAGMVQPDREALAYVMRQVNG